MAMRNQTFFLEEWLRNAVVSNAEKRDLVNASSSAQVIIRAWAELREALSHQNFDARHLDALKILVSSHVSLHVADPQARILLMILSSGNLSLPQESYPLFIRLLYIWARKSRATSQLFDLAVDVVSRLLYQRFPSENGFVLLSDGVLLLGSLSFHTHLSDKSKRLCFECLSKFLQEKCTFSDELGANALAGIGYALSSSSMSSYFTTILDILLRVWGEGATIYQGLLLLHLVEWVLSTSFSSQESYKIDAVRKFMANVKPTHSSYALVMVAAGMLRAVNRSGSIRYADIKNVGEEYIEIFATELLAKVTDFHYMVNEPRSSILLQYLALALARSGLIKYRPPILLSLTFSLLAEVFPLKRIYEKLLCSPTADWAATLYEVRDHVNSLIFKEAGSITGVLCNQYASANEDNKNVVENHIWAFCQKIYWWHHQAKLMLRGSGNELNNEIEKIAESAFLMVVVFASGVTKHRLDARLNQKNQSEISVRILISLSCLEYFRHIRLSAYMDTIRAVIPKVQEYESACVAIVESMLTYNDLISYQGPSGSTAVEYMWSYDEVQTARIVFYLRVIPTFIDKLPTSIFKKALAPTMFLYMGHPNPKVARYSHSLFVAFISSAKDSLEDERVLLKDQLSFPYVKISLENYPNITPFEGLASGVSAIVRHLPAGSPTIFYCINEVAEKARHLCQSLIHDDNFCNKWDGESDPSKKLCDLLLRLLSLTDIQVFPSLLKVLAQLVSELPQPCQNILLNQLYQQIAESDDVIRKPTLVSWLQSLSYLCSQVSHRKRDELTRETASSDGVNIMSLSNVNARL